MSTYANLSMLQLYRRILKAAKDFPSIKREKIIKQIKTDFRSNKVLMDSAVLEKRRAEAERGLANLEVYKDAKKSNDIEVFLHGATTRV